MEYAQEMELLRTLLVLGLVLFCCITDIGMRRIPNMVLLPMLMAGLFLNALGGGVAGLLDSIAGLLAGLAMLLPLHVLGRMGAGDVKLLGVVGALLGTWGAVVAGLATMMAGGVLGAGYILWLAIKPAAERRGRQLAGYLSGFTGWSPQGEPSTQSVRAAEIPYAIAIAVGTVAAMAYTGLFSEVIST